MGIYFNPPDEVKKIGREIIGSSFEELIGQLRKGECLIGLYNRGAFKNAIVLNPPYNVDSDAQYEFIERQVREDGVICEGYFAVKMEGIRGFDDYE